MCSNWGKVLWARGCDLDMWGKASVVDGPTMDVFGAVVMFAGLQDEGVVRRKSNLCITLVLELLHHVSPRFAGTLTLKLSKELLGSCFLGSAVAVVRFDGSPIAMWSWVTPPLRFHPQI